MNETEVIRIKQTKSVTMDYDQAERVIVVQVVSNEGHWQVLGIPISKVFQVKRGLESAVQRFYRKKVK